MRPGRHGRAVRSDAAESLDCAGDGHAVVAYAACSGFRRTARGDAAAEYFRNRDGNGTSRPRACSAHKPRPTNDQPVRQAEYFRRPVQEGSATSRCQSNELRSGLRPLPNFQFQLADPCLPFAQRLLSSFIFQHSDGLTQSYVPTSAAGPLQLPSMPVCLKIPLSPTSRSPRNETHFGNERTHQNAIFSSLRRRLVTSRKERFMGERKKKL